MANLKVVLVGGGSYGWGPKVLEGLLLNPYLDGCQVVLHDIDSTALQLNLELAEKLRRLAGRRTKFVATTAPAVALEGADFVVVTISTGGLEAMRVDLDGVAQSTSWLRLAVEAEVLVVLDADPICG